MPHAVSLLLAPSQPKKKMRTHCSRGDQPNQKKTLKDPEQEKDETGRAKYSRPVYMCLLLQHTQRIASESNAAAAQQIVAGSYLVFYIPTILSFKFLLDFLSISPPASLACVRGIGGVWMRQENIFNQGHSDSAAGSHQGSTNQLHSAHTCIYEASSSAVVCIIYLSSNDIARPACRINNTQQVNMYSVRAAPEMENSSTCTSKPRQL